MGIRIENGLPKSGGNISGNLSLGLSNTSEYVFARAGPTGYLTIAGSESGGGRIELYGDTHGSAADQIRFYTNGNMTGQVAQDGTWTFGLSGTFPIHVFNINTTSAVGAAGGATALPATPTGYLRISINGTEQRIPYYAT